MLSLLFGARLKSKPSTFDDLRCSGKPHYTAGWAHYDAGQEDCVATTRLGEELVLSEKVPDLDIVKWPRALCPLGSDHRTDGKPCNIPQSVVLPRKGQGKLIAQAFALMVGDESFVLEAGTGTGKTVMAIDLIARMEVKTLVIIPKSDLMDQWRKELETFLPGVKVGTIRQNKYDVADKDVVLGMLHSLAKPDKYPGGISSEFGLVIWDEVHRLPADTFQKTAGLFSAHLRLGLSATPTRFDGKEILIQSHIGPVRVRSKAVLLHPVIGVYQTKWKCPRWRRGDVYIKAKHTPGKCGHILNHIADDEQRNSMILKKILAAYKRDRKIVVFSDRITQLECLRNVAIKLGTPAKDTALYVSGKGKAELERAKSAPIIFATYGMMSEGTDIPWLDCCILATPRSNVKQAVGRILREYPDKPTPVVLDFIDFDSHVFARYAENREFFYREIKGTVKKY